MPAIRRDDLYLQAIAAPVQVVIDYKVKALCAAPYPDHPRGCPNVGSGSPDCPPLVPKIEDVVDLARPVYLVGQSYNLGEHARRMGKRHPHWSERQRYNLLYWQPSVRKVLKELVRVFLGKHPGARAFGPEGLGVDVTATMEQSLGIVLEWPPKQTVWKVLLVGYPLPGCENHPVFFP